MNCNKYIMLTLLVSVAAQAEFSEQKNDITIKAAAYEADEQVFDVYGAKLTGERFTAKKLKSVWIEIANTGNRAIEVSNHSVSVMQANKETILNRYKYRAILRPLVTWVVIQAICTWSVDVSLLWDCLLMSMDQGIRRAELVGKYQQMTTQLRASIDQFNNFEVDEVKNMIIDNGIGRPAFNNLSPDERLKYLDTHREWQELLQRGNALDEKAKRIDASRDVENKQLGLAIKREQDECEKKYEWPLYLSNKLAWVNCGAAVISWWYFSSFNKQLELAIDKHLLQDSIIVAPGQTVKKVVMIDAATECRSFAFSTFDARAHIVKDQFIVVL